MYQILEKCLKFSEKSKLLGVLVNTQCCCVNGVAVVSTVSQFWWQWCQFYWILMKIWQICWVLMKIWQICWIWLNLTVSDCVWPCFDCVRLFDRVLTVSDCVWPSTVTVSDPVLSRCLAQYCHGVWPSGVTVSAPVVSRWWHSVRHSSTPGGDTVSDSSKPGGVRGVPP